MPRNNKNKDVDVNSQQTSKKEDNPNSSNNKRHQPKIDANMLYVPSIVRFTCRGSLSISSSSNATGLNGMTSQNPSQTSSTTSTTNNNNDHHRTKKTKFADCKGISDSRIVRTLPPMPAHAALHSFKMISGAEAGFGGYHHQHPHHQDAENAMRRSRGGSNGNGSPTSSPISNHNARRMYELRKELNQAQAQEKKKAILNGGEPRYPIIMDFKWDEMKATLEENRSSSTNKKIFHDSIKCSTTMYGKSHFDLLMLSRPHDNIPTDQESKQEPQERHYAPIKYAGIASNDYGIAKRRAKAEEQSRTLESSMNNIKIGFLEIQVGSFDESYYEDEEIEKTGVRKNRNLDNDKNRNGNEEESMLQNLTSDKKSFSQSDIIPKLKDAKVFISKCGSALDLLMVHMRQNANFLKREIQNDFVNRTYSSSEKIVDSGERNLKRMKKVLIETYKFWNDYRRSG